MGKHGSARDPCNGNSIILVKVIVSMGVTPKLPSSPMQGIYTITLRSAHQGVPFKAKLSSKTYPPVRCHVCRWEGKNSSHLTSSKICRP